MCEGRMYLTSDDCASYNVSDIPIACPPDILNALIFETFVYRPDNSATLPGKISRFVTIRLLANGSHPNSESDRKLVVMW